MATKYKQPSLSTAVRFEKAPLSGLEFSKMKNNPRVYTTYNAGDIVPLYYEEVLPHSTFSIDVEFINRLLSATIRPTMGAMQMDIFAYFVPNRIVNESWKNVQGENTSGYWSAPEIELAPLLASQKTNAITVPVGSVADYYGFPTQAGIPAVVLQQCNDLKFRGYLEIYNNYFRDQNYQPPINYSKLNIYNGFFDSGEGGVFSGVGVNGGSGTYSIGANAPADGSYPDGAIIKAIYGEGKTDLSTGVTVGARPKNSVWSALNKPLKANKLHDPFTSGLPSPQKGPEVFFGVAESAPVITSSSADSITLSSVGMMLKNVATKQNANAGILGTQTVSDNNGNLGVTAGTDGQTFFNSLAPSNLIADLTQATGVSINDLRKSAAIQQVYEMLARGGSRYLESLRSFFGIETENPFKDIPTQLGHIRKELDLYQVAQTSASVEGESAQGSLTGFGYTSKDGNLFTYTALEHGYIHFLVVVRHRNIYPSLLMPDNFRTSTLDWYYPQLANIGEQPVRLATLNPFNGEAVERTICYQEAWWEYRFSPDRVSGYCRTGLNDSLDIWTYADDFDGNFTHVNGDWLYSNSQEVLDRTLAVTSELSPQFIIMMEFDITRQIPMPVYSVPGLDIL